MIEITRQYSGLAQKIETIADVVEVLEWVINHDGLYCTVSARADNEWLIEVGGVTVASVYVSIGQWIVFDGDVFHALSDEEFAAKGYATA